MRWVVFGSGALLALVALLGEGRADQGWVALFDGGSLDGWVQRNGTAELSGGGWGDRRADQRGQPELVSGHGAGVRRLRAEFEVRVDDALNSGVQIRSGTKQRSTGEGPDERAGRVFGPQVEIEASPGLAGYVYGEATGRGWLTPEARRVPHAHFRNGQWNRYRIVAKGPRIRTWVNGEPIEDLTDEATYGTHPEGFIGLQVHAIEPGTGPYEVAWRNLRLRELPE